MIDIRNLDKAEVLKVLYCPVIAIILPDISSQLSNVRNVATGTRLPMSIFASKSIAML